MSLSFGIIWPLVPAGITFCTFKLWFNASNDQWLDYVGIVNGFNQLPTVLLSTINNCTLLKQININSIALIYQNCIGEIVN